MDANPRIWLRSRVAGDRLAWLGFEAPSRIIQTSDPGGVLPALEKIDAAVSMGAWAAGFLSYEAAPGMDSALTVKRAKALPLLWFGLFEKPAVVEDDLPPFCDGSAAGVASLAWTPTLDQRGFEKAMEAIRRYLVSGDTYQVNFTFRMRAAAPPDVAPLFAVMVRGQTTPYAGFVDTGRHALLSVSPELFFSLDGDFVTCRPMKGTARRGLWSAADIAASEDLAHSPKNQSENVMIVDMIRNDLGRVAEAGTVKVGRLFDVERYETVLQMTSTVTARSRAPLTDLMCALFPCASVTGAPKRRTMEIIAELESDARGIYTGAIGFFGPGRKAQFNVAIRTVHIDRDRCTAEYGTGAGIVWDSVPANEYVECLDKARVLFEQSEPFKLLETMLWTPGRGIRLLKAHIDRLRSSAAYFGFKVDENAVLDRIVSATVGLPPAPHRIRMLVARNGMVDVETAHLPSRDRRARTVVLASEPVSTADRFFYHKTTRRGVYDAARRSAGGADDVLLWNEEGEVTESTIANVVFKRGGRLITPPVRSGLLPGILRERLVARGRVKEEVILKDSLRDGENFCLINSVRGIVRAVFRKK